MKLLILTLFMTMLSLKANADEKGGPKDATVKKSDFTKTEQITKFIRDQIELSFKEIEESSTKHDVPHADYDLKREEFLKLSAEALKVFEKEMKEQIITPIEKLAKNYNSMNAMGSYSEFEIEELKNSVMSYAKAQRENLEEKYHKMLIKVFLLKIIFEAVSPMTISQLDVNTWWDGNVFHRKIRIDDNVHSYNNSDYQIIKKVASSRKNDDRPELIYIDSRNVDKFTRIINTPAYLNFEYFTIATYFNITRPYSDSCLTWSCPELYRLLLKKWSKLFMKNLNLNINFKFSENDIFTLNAITEEQMGPALRFLEKQQVYNTENYVFSISKEELTQIQQQKEKDLKDQEKKNNEKEEKEKLEKEKMRIAGWDKVQAERKALVSSIIAAINQLSAQTRTKEYTVLTCIVSVTGAAQKIAALAHPMPNSGYNSHPIAKEEKEIILQGVLSKAAKRKKIRQEQSSCLASLGWGQYL